MPFEILKVLDHYDIVYFITGRIISNRLGVAAPQICRRLKDCWINQWVTEVFVEQPLASPGSANKQGSLGKGSKTKQKKQRKVWSLSILASSPGVPWCLQIYLDPSFSTESESRTFLGYFLCSFFWVKNLHRFVFWFFSRVKNLSPVYFTVYL